MMNQDQYHSAQSDKVFYVNDAKENRSIPLTVKCYIVITVIKSFLSYLQVGK